VSSALVGSLWALAPAAAWGFGAAAALQGLGALIIAAQRQPSGRRT